MYPDRMHSDRSSAFVPVLMTVAAGVILGAGFLMAQAPAPPKASAPVATVNQLMRLLFFPDSNVVFFTQRYNPAEVKRADEPSASTDPLTGVFGGWEAVENSALTMADSADLLLTTGRKCSNGKDAPIGNADWVQFVNGLREASMVSYKAALTKDKDKMIAASETLALSCQNCHNKYRARVRCQ